MECRASRRPRRSPPRRQWHPAARDAGLHPHLRHRWRHRRRYSHAFKVSLTEHGASITPGTVNGIEPVIGGVLLSGDEAGENIPELRWKKPALDAKRRGYIALEAICDREWKIVQGDLTVVQVAYYDSLDGKAPPDGSGGIAAAGGIPGLPGRRVRYPIARLIQRKSGELEVFQIVKFDVTHRVQARTADIARHFFSPA